MLTLTGPQLRIHAYGPIKDGVPTDKKVESYIYPNGGKTIVTITTPDGWEVCASYRTPITEPFNRRYSLERALKQAYAALRHRTGLTREERKAAYKPSGRVCIDDALAAG